MEDEELYIKDNIATIQKEILKSCEKVGRDPKEIQLIAVTKTIDPVRINEAIGAGITDIGENKVQEIMDKYSAVSEVNWHMIGHLQTNKVKYIIDKVKLIHSLDSIKLAEEINKKAKQRNIMINTLIQVNVAQEETKFGIAVDEIDDFIEKLQLLNYVQVKGLMTIAPYDEDPERVRKYFRILKSIFDKIKMKNLQGIEMKYLSMGMSNDFKIAIEEGANMIRIGTAIFGKRN